MTIRTTVETETIRCVDNSMSGIQKPPFRGVVTIRYISQTVALASAAHGKFTRSDVKRIYKHLANKGIETLIADRAANHRMPRGKLIPDGMFAGMFEVDLMR